MSEAVANQPVMIQIQPTPNPNAWKFVLDRNVLNEGKATFSSLDEAKGNVIGTELLKLNSIRQIHLFQNVITVTARFDADEKELHEQVTAIIQTRMVMHDPNFGLEEAKKSRRADLSPELQQIEEILDRTIRPGLQGDGGDLEIVKYENNQLYVSYMGACGTCPSSTTGTLMAIEGILRDEFNPQIEVIPL